jgi:UDP-N-acetylmuramate dehydrogenase
MMMSTQTAKLLGQLPTVRGTYRPEVPMSSCTWLGVGGPADVVFRPADAEDLAHFLSACPKHIPIQVIGVGSNILVRDGGIRGVVVRLGRGFTWIEPQEDTLYVGAGVLDFNLATYCLHHALTGLEFFVGIPGTVGGALAMNAGCYGRETAAVLAYAEIIDDHGVMHQLTPTDIGYVYRGHSLPEEWIFTAAMFKVTPGDTTLIEAEMKRITEARQATQPIRSKTAGSTFVNPTGGKVWEFIDAVGMRGYRLGGAKVSEMHCNFLINENGATAADLENLGEEVRRRVQENSGMLLEWEVKRIGESV